MPVAGHSADVTIGYKAKVVGTRDVDKLADSLDAVDKHDGTDLDVSAKVTGTKDVDKLSTALDKLPDTPTTVGVSLDVDASKPVTDLADAVRKLPGPATVTAAVDVTGTSDLATLKTDLSQLPATTPVSITVDADTQGVQHVKQSLQDVHDTAKNAHDETSGFASELTGTLGSQFSEGTGYVSDFAEQFRNLRDRVRESDDKIGTVAKAAAGIGGTLLAGFGIDAIIGVFSQMNEAAAQTKANVKELADQIVASGGLIDDQFQKLQVQQIIADPGFESLTKAGADYADTLDGLRGDTQALARVHGQLKAAADRSAESIRQSGGSEEQAQAAYQTVQTLDDMAKKFDASGKSAIKSGRDLQNYYVHAGLAEDQVGKTANGVDLLSAAMQDNAKDTATATAAVQKLNSTDLHDKKSTITATDKATGKVTTYNHLDVNDKNGTITARDTATGTLHTYNHAAIDPKTGVITATDTATGKLTTFNSTAITDKKAVVDADTQPAKDRIAELNGVTVTGVVHLIPYVQDPRTGAYVPADSLGTRSVGTVAAGPLDAPATDTVPDVRRVSLVSSTPTYTAPLTVIIQGTVIDPAGAARALSQVLTRADRRVRPLNRGGKYGVARAPV